MNHSTIFRIVLGLGLLPIAWSALETPASGAFLPDDGVAPRGGQSVQTVLRGDNQADLLLVQGMSGRSGLGRSGGGSVYTGQATKHPGPSSHPGPHPGPHPTPHPQPDHWPHHRPVYIYPYTSYYTPGYTYDYSYSQPAPVVTAPATPPSNPLPPTAAGAAGIQIVNPAQTGVPLTYTLNGTQYTIRPGETQNLQLDRSWTIEFDRGGQFGAARYDLAPGVYAFSPTARGWELYQQPAMPR